MFQALMVAQLFHLQCSIVSCILIDDGLTAPNMMAGNGSAVSSTKLFQLQWLLVAQPFQVFYLMVI